MAKKVRLGFVGCGYMGQNAHIANYAKIDDCELVALAEGRQKTAEAVARRYGIQELYGDHHEMLERSNLDGVVGIMGFHLFSSLVTDLLNAGKAVTTEKPMCIRPENGRRLAALADEKGIVYQVGYMKRHDPGAKYVRETVRRWRESGEAGNLTFMRVTMPSGDWIMEHEPPVNLGDPAPAYEGQTGEGAPEWMSKEQGNHYIAFVNFYIHQVNLIRYLIGEDYHIAYADPHGRTLTALSESGVVIVLEMSSYGLQHRWDEFYTLNFDRGQIRLEMPAPMARQRAGKVTVYRQAGFDGSGPAELSPVLSQKWAFEEQARAFVACLRDGTPTISPASDGAKDLEFSEEYIRAVAASRE
ncbi:Gfo/Idh/MocA family oxidoreductase [Candidatus Poribacteria bacterium]|nr:Gfo/Idh/MocA family oxidoreductase [Candidatus Poribacteria bacterium]